MPKEYYAHYRAMIINLGNNLCGHFQFTSPWSSILTLDPGAASGGVLFE